MRPIVQNLEAGVAGGCSISGRFQETEVDRPIDRQAAASGGSGPDDASAAAAGLLLVHFIVPLLQMYFPPSPLQSPTIGPLSIL